MKSLYSRKNILKKLNKVSVTQHILLNPWQGRMGDHAAISHSTECAQALPIGRVDLWHSEATEVALDEKQIFSPQGGAVWVNEHLRHINKHRLASQRP